MRYRTLITLAAACAVAGALVWGLPLQAGTQRARPVEKAQTIVDAWRALPAVSSHGCGDDLVFDYKEHGGMRNFFCRALTVFSWKTFLHLAPVEPFRAGPHRGSKLDLDSERDFGRYNPEFVRWAARALVPAADDPRLRADTQKSYERYARTLARTYYRVWRVISSDRAWLEAEVRFYLDAADRGQVEALGRTLDLYHDVLGTAREDWGGHDPNHVRSATTWWLRRHHDRTAELWLVGLERLLRTYDAAWLDAERRKRPRRPPQRPRQSTPEYR